MPLIKFENKKDEGTYLLITSGEVGWFPNGVFGVTEHFLQQLDPRFKEKGIRYRRLRPEEVNPVLIGKGASTAAPSNTSRPPGRPADCGQ
jgi:hypothetical protein